MTCHSVPQLHRGVVISSRNEKSSVGAELQTLWRFAESRIDAVELAARGGFLDADRLARFGKGDEARIRAKREARVFRFGDRFEWQIPQLAPALGVINFYCFGRLPDGSYLPVRTNRHLRCRQFEIL